MRGAIALLRRFAELERSPLERDRLTAWVDHLAYMLEHPHIAAAAA